MTRRYHVELSGDVADQYLPRPCGLTHDHTVNPKCERNAPVLSVLPLTEPADIGDVVQVTVPCEDCHETGFVHYDEPDQEPCSCDGGRVLLWLLTIDRVLPVANDGYDEPDGPHVMTDGNVAHLWDGLGGEWVPAQLPDDERWSAAIVAVSGRVESEEQ